MIARIFVFTLVAILFGYGPNTPMAQEPMKQAKGKIIPFSNKQEAVYGEQDVKKEDYERVVPKTTYVDKGDYYYLSNGKVTSFLRLKNTYVLISDNKKVSAQMLSQTTQSRFGEQLAVITEHPLTGYVMVRIKEEGRTSSILSELYQIDPAISLVTQVLTNKERGGTIAVLPQIVVKVSADADKKESIAELERMNLSLVSRLSYTMSEFEFEIDEHISDVGRIFEITREVAELPFVDWAEPNFLVGPIKQFTPNDPMYNNQWHLNNTGQNGAVADADIDAPEGWDTSRGDGAVIAVFDDGVDTAHEDLTIWANPGETGGGKETNGIDDDGNGYIDDYQGWDFGDNDNDPSPATADDNHGTSVAGVAGATGNNGIGVSGGAVGAVILPVRSGSMTCTNWGNAMRYAGKYGDVVNNSWGISGCESSLNSAIFDVVNGNIPGARRGNKGTPVLFATGNAASGWLKFTLSGFPTGTYDFHWQYVKNVSDSEGYDTVWLDNISWPGGGTTDFESETLGSVPSGFTSDGNATWSVVSDGTHARGATGKSVKAGTITHSQETNLRITRAVGSGTLTYWAWVSSELNYDFFKFYVNGTRYHLYSPGQYSGHTNEVGYPASNPATIAVGASTDGGPGGVEERSDYSQFGPEVDVVAPSSGGGQGITTTDRMGADGYEASSNYTSTFGGTSSATPLVAGVVADILAYKPNLTAAQLRQALRDGTDKIGPYTYSRNDYYGYGRVNLYKTLQLLTDPSSTALPHVPLLLLDD